MNTASQQSDLQQWIEGSNSKCCTNFFRLLGIKTGGLWDNVLARTITILDIIYFCVFSQHFEILNVSIYEI